MNAKALASVMVLIMVTSSLLLPFSSASSDDSSLDISYEEMNCTGYYVGSAVSEDGTTMIGQTDDYGPLIGEVCYEYFEPVNGVSGRTLVSMKGHVYNLPDSTYGYFVHRAIGKDVVKSCGSGSVNNMGVACTAAITAYGSKGAIDADPYIQTGLYEDTISRIVASSCDSAKSGVDLLLSIVDRDGCAEGAVAMIADREEAWYIEIYSGHQYVAIKLPEDKMATFGNEFNIRSVNEGLEYIASPGLISLAVEYGFAVWSESGELDVKKTYAEPNMASCHMRTWIGHVLFSDKTVGDYSDDDEYGLLFTPKKSIGLKDVMDYTRNRFEGTKYCPDTTGYKSRPVGVEMMHEAHILQIYKDLPKEMCIVFWGCLSPSEFSTFIPMSNNVTAFADVYGSFSKVYGFGEETASGMLKMLNTLCGTSRAALKEAVSGYWSDLERYLIGIYPKVLDNMLELYKKSPSDASHYATNYSMGIEENVYNDAYRLFDQSLHHLMNTTNTSRDVKVMVPLINAGEYSERYGWTHSVSGDTMTITDGKTVVTIKDTSTKFKPCCILTIDGVESEVSFYNFDGAFCIPAKYAYVFSVNEPVIVYHEHQSKSTNDSTLLIVAAILAIAIVAIAAAVLYKRYQKHE